MTPEHVFFLGGGVLHRHSESSFPLARKPKFGHDLESVPCATNMW